MSDSTSIAIRRLAELWGLLALALVLLLVIFQVPLERAAGLPSFSDELLLLIFLAMISISAIENRDARRILLVFGLAFGVLLTLSLQAIPHRGLFAVLMQIFVHLKLIIYVGFAWLFIGPHLSRNVLIILLVVTIVGLVINLMTGAYFNDIFNSPIKIRGGLVRPIGIQADTASLGTTIALIGVLLVTLVSSADRKSKLVLLALFSLLLILSSSRTSLIIVPIIVLWWFKESFRTFLAVAAVAIMMTMVIPSNKYVDTIVEITRQNIEWTTENPVESGYIRGIMIFFGFQTANDNLPFGRGAATFGTVFSEDSVVYAELGLRDSYFFIETDGIYDSNIASLLGEFGYLGTLIYLGLLFITMRLFRSREWQQPSEFVFALPLTLLAFSVSTPIFMNSYPAFITALVVVAAYQHRQAVPDATC